MRLVVWTFRRPCVSHLAVHLPEEHGAYQGCVQAQRCQYEGDHSAEHDRVVGQRERSVQYRTQPRNQHPYDEVSEPVPAKVAAPLPEPEGCVETILACLVKSLRSPSFGAGERGDTLGGLLLLHGL